MIHVVECVSCVEGCMFVRRCGWVVPGRVWTCGSMAILDVRLCVIAGRLQPARCFVVMLMALVVVNQKKMGSRMIETSVASW